MPNLATALKSEIARLARKEVRAETESLKKLSSQYRSEIAALKRQIKALQYEVRAAGRSRPAASKPEAESDGVRRRFSAKRLAAMRSKLGISAQEFGALVGVTGQSIYKWEAGNARPRAAQLEAIASVRGLGKREVAAKLATLKPA